MEELRLPTYGGQAVIEGVMMRGKSAVAIAMRSPDHKIVIHEEKLGGIYKSRLVKIPFLRGLVMLWDALGLGIRALTISANTQSGEDEKIEGPALLATLILALAFSAGLFFITPAAIGHLAERLVTPAAAQSPAVVESNSTVEASPAPVAEESSADQAVSGMAAWLGNLVEGLVRLMILVGYIWIVGRIPDIQRVFAYHGAEHKTINAFEAGAELTPESVARFSLEHPRCGTAFLLTLVLFSVLVFALLGPLPVSLRLISRIAFLPILAGLAYEYIRWTATHLNSPLVQLLIKPNLALQRMTTREPNPEMLEVSIAAFNAMRTAEREINLVVK
jgi:uncharacterized protein YqhQ